MGSIASHLGLTPDPIVDADLRRLKQYVESAATETTAASVSSLLNELSSVTGSRRARALPRRTGRSCAARAVAARRSARRRPRAARWYVPRIAGTTAHRDSTP